MSQQFPSSLSANNRRYDLCLRGVKIFIRELTIIERGKISLFTIRKNQSMHIIYVKIYNNVKQRIGENKTHFLNQMGIPLKYPIQYSKYWIYSSAPKPTNSQQVINIKKHS